MTPVDDITDDKDDIAPTEGDMAVFNDAGNSEGKAASKLKTALSRQKIQNVGKAVIYRLFRLTGELVAIVLGLAFFWVCAVNILLARKTMDVSFLEPNAALWFSNAFDGKSADVGKMTLSWHAPENTISFNARDIRVTGENNTVVQGIESVTTELALRDVVRARLDPIRVEIDGGQLTWRRTQDGKVVAGLGTPETVGAFGPTWTGQTSQQPRSGQRPQYKGRLRDVKIRNASLYVVDEKDGLNQRLSGTSLNMSRSAGAVTFDGGAFIDGDNPAPVSMSGNISANLADIDVSIAAEGFNPAQVLPQRGPLSAGRSLDAPLTFKAQIRATTEQGLTALLIDAKAGAGTLRFGGREDAFSNAAIKGAYDPATQTMKLSQVKAQSARLSFDGAVALSDIGNPQDGFFTRPVGFAVGLDKLMLDRTPQFERPFDLRDVVVNGVWDRALNKADFEAVSADFGNFQPVLSGVFDRDDTGAIERLSVKGAFDGTLSKAELLSLWPKGYILGARNWIENSILEATLENLVLDFDADAAALAAPALPNEALRLSFDLYDGSVRYIRTMTPATQASGQGVLEGNKATFTLDKGQIGDIALRNGIVEIPQIYPYGGLMTIAADGAGPVPSLLSLIDQKPFEYVSQYGVDGSGFTGRGDIRLTLSRPLRERIKYSDITYSVTGNMRDVTAPFSLGQYTLTDGNVSLLVDRNGLSVKGPVKLGPWNADLAWTEIFDQGATPTKYAVQGVIDRDVLDGFGVGFREFLSGDMFVTIDAVADGLEITSAAVQADLTNTDLRIGPYWSKEAGIQGEVSGTMALLKGAGLSLSEATMTAPGFDVAGSLDMAQDFRLKYLDLSRAKIAGFVDAAVQMKPSDTGDKFDLLVTGDYLDVSPFVTSMIDRSGGSALDVPVLMTAALRRLALNEAYVLRDANVLFAHDGVGVRQARLKGDTVDGGLSINLVTDDAESMRKLSVDIPNASDAAFAFLGLDSLTGGRVQLEASMPVVGFPGPLTGEASIENVRLVNAPIMTRILSLASLQGLADALGGEGLSFETLDMPFSLDGQNLSIRSGRAAGPALGMTGEGEIDFAAKTVDFDGVLVPAYTANSLLGDIPLIGDIFVGKKGEGIFALSYTVRGPFSQSQVAVNPLSALTPGFLRGIFRPQREDLPDQVREAIKEVAPTTAPKDD